MTNTVDGRSFIIIIIIIVVFVPDVVTGVNSSHFDGIFGVV
jgi:hypothetical protein